MIEDYRIIQRYGRSERLNTYRINRLGNKAYDYVYIEEYKTPIGMIRSEEWLKKAKEAVISDGKEALMKEVWAYSKAHFGWFMNQSETEREEEVLNTLAGHYYENWKGFSSEEASSFRVGETLEAVDSFTGDRRIYKVTGRTDTHVTFECMIEEIDGEYEVSNDEYEISRDYDSRNGDEYVYLYTFNGEEVRLYSNDFK